MRIGLWLALFAAPAAGLADSASLEAALKESTTAYLRGDYRDAAMIIESALPQEQSGEAASLALSQLATLNWMQGRYVDAERAVRRSLASIEALHGRGHPDAARELSKLGGVLRAQGRYAEAETAFLGAIAVLEPAFGVDHAYVGDCLNSLAELSFLQQRNAEAESRYWRAYMIRSYLHGPESSQAGETLTGLGVVYLAQSRDADAGMLFARALAIAERPPRADGSWGRLDGRDLLQLHALERDHTAYRGKIVTGGGVIQHPEYAQHFDGLGDLYRALGRYGEAEAMYRRSIALRTRAFGSRHPEIVQALANIAALHRQRGDYQGGLDALRPASNVAATLIASHPFERSEYTQGERQRWRPVFLLMLSLLTREPRIAPQPPAEEAFAALQYANPSSAGQSVAQMTQQFAHGDEQLAKLIRDAAGTEQPLTLADAQALLVPDEALVVYAAGEREAYLAVVRRERAEVRRIDAAAPELAAKLREELAGRRVLLVAGGAIEGPGFTALPSVASLRALRQLNK